MLDWKIKERRKSLQWHFDDSNTDGPFTMADLNMFLSP